MSLVLFLVTLGLAARLTRLMVRDSITQPYRDKLQPLWVKNSSWDLEESKWKIPAQYRPVKFLQELTECDWCSGVWASAFAFAAAYTWQDSTFFFWFATAATASYLIGMGAAVEDKLYGDHDHA